MIKAIIFDLGGVLFTNGTKQFKTYLAHTYSLNENKIKDVLDGPIGSRYRKSKITRDQFWKQLKTQLHIKAQVAELENKWISGYVLIEETKDILLELSKNYKIFFLSDNIKERAERLNNKYHFISWFNGGIFSHEVGIRKPHPQIFQLILQKAGVKPEETVFIDDKAEFLETPSRMGMTTILFENPEKLRESLLQLDLLSSFSSKT